MERYLYNGDGEKWGFALYGRPGNQEGGLHNGIRIIEESQHIRSYPATPCTQRAVLATILRQVPMPCDAECLKHELQHFEKIVEQNGCCGSDIRRTLNPKQKPKLQTNKITGTTKLSYQHIISNSISRLIERRNIRTIHIPKRKIIHMLRSVKDERDLKVSGDSSKQQISDTKCVAGN